MIQKLQILLVLGVGLGLVACNSETGQANDQAPVQNGADLNAAAAQPAIELPPGIAVSRPYRCADGSTVYVDISEERRAGKECVSTCSSRWQADHLKNKIKHQGITNVVVRLHQAKTRQ